jgi:hypothetical protein
MAAKKFPHIPMLIGSTTDEYTILIPTDFNITTDTQLLGLFQHQYVSVPKATIQQLMDFFPLADNPNSGPPGSGVQWSRTVNIVNRLQAFCPFFHQAVDIASVAAVWKCEF